jgi:hypothetical protein
MTVTVTYINSSLRKILELLGVLKKQKENFNEIQMQSWDSEIKYVKQNPNAL